MVYNILITAALTQEMKVIKKNIKNLKITGLNIKFLITWVGNYNSIYSLNNFLNKNDLPDFILNFWVCWKNKKSSDEVFQVYRIFNFSNSKEIVLPVFTKLYPLKSILSSDQVIINESDLKWEEYVDMESYWLTFVSNKSKIPIMLIKIPFDIVSTASNNVDIKDLIDRLDNVNYWNILLWIKELLLNNKLSNYNDLSYYKPFFGFTFSEFEIFKKNYNKFLAYWLSFEDFFDINKELSKDDFLQKMIKK